MITRMKPKKKIEQQAEWHERLIASAYQIATDQTITLPDAEWNPARVLEWDKARVQEGLDRLADAITGTFETLDEEAINTNTDRLQNIEDAIRALLTVQEGDTEEDEQDTTVPEAVPVSMPSLDVQREQPYDFMDYLNIIGNSSLSTQPQDALTHAIEGHIRTCLRIWFLRMSENEKPFSDAFLKEASAIDAYDRLRVEGMETRQPEAAKEAYMQVAERVFSEVQRERKSV